MACFHRFGQATASFGYDFKTAFDQPLLPSLGLEGLNCHPCQFSADQLDSFDYIDEAPETKMAPSEHLFGGGFDLRPQNPVKAPPRHDVGFAAENSFRRVLYVHQFEEPE
jgi:hypothetical protein